MRSSGMEDYDGHNSLAGGSRRKRKTKRSKKSRRNRTRGGNTHTKGPAMSLKDEILNGIRGGKKGSGRFRTPGPGMPLKGGKGKMRPTMRPAMRPTMGPTMGPTMSPDM